MPVDCVAIHAVLFESRMFLGHRSNDILNPHLFLVEFVYFTGNTDTLPGNTEILNFDLHGKMPGDSQVACKMVRKARKYSFLLC